MSGKIDVNQMNRGTGSPNMVTSKRTLQSIKVGDHIRRWFTARLCHQKVTELGVAFHLS